MDSDSMTIQEFIDKHQLEMICVKLITRPDMSADIWSKDASHWQCEIKRVGPGNHKRISTIYSMGSAHKGKPELDYVLDSLILDATSSESSFSDWCGEFGYDADSRKAYATWEACGKVADDLRDFLGRKLYAELMACERL